MKAQQFIPKQGDVIAWESKDQWTNRMYTSIAIMMNEDEFSVCLNFRGRHDEQDRIWEWDSVFFDDKKIRKAESTEVAYLLTKLIEHGYPFSYENEKVSVNIQWLDDFCDDMEAAEVRVEAPTGQGICSYDRRVARFSMYLEELVSMYVTNKSLRGMSYAAKKHRISSISKDVFFASGMHTASIEDTHRPMWLTFCSDMYVYALDKSRGADMPVFANYKNR